MSVNKRRKTHGDPPDECRCDVEEPVYEEGAIVAYERCPDWLLARGMCHLHYYRWDRTGGINGGDPLKRRTRWGDDYHVLCLNPRCEGGDPEDSGRRRIHTDKAFRNGSLKPFCSPECRKQGEVRAFPATEMHAKLPRTDAERERYAEKPTDAVSATEDSDAAQTVPEKATAVSGHENEGEEA